MFAHGWSKRSRRTPGPTSVIPRDTFQRTTDAETNAVPWRCCRQAHDLKAADVLIAAVQIAYVARP
jgi:hypothetical protein